MQKEPTLANLLASELRGHVSIALEAADALRRLTQAEEDQIETVAGAIAGVLDRIDVTEVLRGAAAEMARQIAARA